MLLAAENAQRRVAFLPGVNVTLRALKPKDFPDDPKTLGEHLKKRRVEQRMLQREAAPLVGVSVDTYRGWELDRIRPYAASWRAVIGFLG
jgi:DNA-binding XRE family transcriptional regulator